MREIWRTLYGAFFLLILGGVVGLAANGARGRGQVNLFRPYIPPTPTQNGAIPNGGSEQWFIDSPYALLGFDEVRAIYEDEMRLGLFDVFIDARDDGPYQRGHIPGAIQFFPYEADLYAENVLQHAGAERFIIYCHGGNCEDSILAGQELERLGFIREQLYIYKGGWEQWSAEGMPFAEGSQ